MRRFVVILGLMGVTVLGAQGIAQASTTIRVHVLRTGAGPLVGATVVIHGKAFPFLIDTGATTTLIDPAVARLAHLKKVGKGQRLCGVSSCTTQHPVRVRHWNLGGRPLPGIKATVGALAGIGRFHISLLGADVLSKFGSVKINYRAQTMTLG